MAPSTREEWSGQLSLFDDDSVRQPPVGRNVLVFDLETQRSFQDVGGRGNLRALGMSVGVVYSFRDDRFTSFFESDAGALIDLLCSAEQVIGYNLLGFDYEVLKGYREAPMERTPTLDLMDDLRQRLGFRPKLDSVVGPTLKAVKTADGLAALEWWKQGRLDLIEKYCIQDVALTRDLFVSGRRNRHVLVSRPNGAPRKVEVSW